MNPYAILSIDQQATKKEIITAAALALRQREYSGQEIAAAQRELLDPVAKAVHDFLLFPDLILQAPPLSHPVPIPPNLAELKRLSLFDQAS